MPDLRTSNAYRYLKPKTDKTLDLGVCLIYYRYITNTSCCHHNDRRLPIVNEIAKNNLERFYFKLTLNINCIILRYSSSHSTIKNHHSLFIQQSVQITGYCNRLLNSLFFIKIILFYFIFFCPMTCHILLFMLNRLK